MTPPGEDHVHLGQGKGFTASKLFELGCFPFQLKPHDPANDRAFKQPLSVGWQSRAEAVTSSELTALDKAKCNLGLSLGPSRLVAVDTDSPEAEAWVAGNLPPTPWTTKTAQGFHRIYRLAEGQDPPRNSVKRHLDIDIKAAGGYVLAPGSFHHAAGVTYEAVGDWNVPIEDLPVFDPAWLPDKRAKKEVGPAPVPLPTSPTASSSVDRVHRYLDTLDAAVEGAGGSSALFTAAMKCRTALDLGLEETIDALWQRFNPRCQPPWDDTQRSDFDHHVTDGWNESKPHGSAPSSPPSTPEPRNAEIKTLEVGGPPDVKGFRWEKSGLHCTTQQTIIDGEVVEVLEWIAPPFTLPGTVRDGDSDQWGFLVGWYDPDQVRHEELIHNEDLFGEGAGLFRVLARGGMVLPTNLKLRKLLLEYLTRAIPKIKARVRIVETLGWIGGGQAFVMPNGLVVGDSGEVLRYAGERRHTPTTKGTLAGWQEGVAGYAPGNPFLAFAISCAFTGPLLSIVRPDGSGGFNLQGSSSKGKSTCMESASSVWCDPDPLPQWRATTNGLEGMCAARNDGFMALDELSQIDPKEAGQAAYLIANGRDKARMTKTGEARIPKTWRIVFLSSGEQTLEDKLSEDGKNIRAGHEVRVVDIPCGAEGLFQDAHGLLSMAHLAEHLKIQARNHYGHAAPAFLKNLCDAWNNRAALTAKLKELETDWLAKAVPDGSDGQVRRVAARFALVAIAGELAQTMRILPWPTGEASRAASTCFKAWLDRRGHHGASERERGLRAVVDFLSLHGLSRFAGWHNVDSRPINCCGVRKEAPPLGWDFYFTPTGWKEATKGFDSREVARNAIAEGLLEAADDGTPYKKERTPHGQGRYYIIRASGLGQFRVETA